LPPARWPPPLGLGARVGVAALSGAVDLQRLEAGLDQLRGLGFEPVAAANLRRRKGMFAGSDDERLAAFHDLAGDPNLPAIVFARGGHGLLRVLPRIDWRLLRRRPRAYVGYSDLTPFLLGVVERLGLVAFHGPMVAAEVALGLTSVEQESLLAALEGLPPSPIDLPTTLRPGRARGLLLGGCLSLLAATLGTPWRPRLAGAIAFFEEVGEPLYRFDRLLTHLTLSGTLAGIAGLVIGSMTGVGEDLTDSVRGSEPRWLSSVRETALGTGQWPAASGLAVGHGRPNLTLPLGVPVTLEALPEPAGGTASPAGARLTFEPTEQEAR
jgi:muramoyltetrapeptide carboxypeptidase